MTRFLIEYSPTVFAIALHEIPQNEAAIYFHMCTMLCISHPVILAATATT